jgi:ribonuclease P protein component
LAKQFTLGKQERLKSRKIIEQLFNEGKSFTVSPFRVFYSFGEIMSSPLQFGVATSKKNFKKAIDRNRVKRIIRETYRLQKLSLQQKLKEKKKRLNIFFIYNGKESPVYEETYETIKLILNRLDKIVDEAN